jgi:hypothetical protein
VLARDEFDPAAAVLACRVEEVFVREGLIWELRIGGQTIRTTAEHPHYVPGRGWVACHELRVGDRVLTELGAALPVEALHDTGLLERVYNFRVAATHTYFVGAPEWGFAVWVHNEYRLSHGRAAQHGSPRHHNAMVREARTRHPEMPMDVRTRQARTNQALINPADPNGKALSTLRPDVQKLGTDGRVYISEVNHSGGPGYHEQRRMEFEGILGPLFGGYNPL